MGISDYLLQRIENEAECQYGSTDISKEERKVIDLLYEWLEAKRVTPDGCLDYSPGVSFQLQITDFRVQDVFLLSRQLTDFYEMKGYDAEVKFNSSSVKVFVHIDDNWVEPLEEDEY
jgi:hypothetical protein